MGSSPHPSWVCWTLQGIRAALVIGILHTNPENCLTSLRGPVHKEGHFIWSKTHYLISPVSQLLLLRTGLIMILPFQFSSFYSFLCYLCTGGTVNSSTGGTVNSMCMCEYQQQLLVHNIHVFCPTHHSKRGEIKYLEARVTQGAVRIEPPDYIVFCEGNVTSNDGSDLSTTYLKIFHTWRYLTKR